MAAAEGREPAREPARLGAGPAEGGGLGAGPAEVGGLGAGPAEAGARRAAHRRASVSVRAGSSYAGFGSVQGRTHGQLSPALFSFVLCLLRRQPARRTRVNETEVTPCLAEL